MIKIEEICFILKNIFKCDSISYKNYDYADKTAFVLKKDGKSYAVSIEYAMIREIPFRDVAGYISKRYIDLMLYGKDRRNK
jgi:hypothetical protein